MGDAICGPHLFSPVARSVTRTPAAPKRRRRVSSRQLAPYLFLAPALLFAAVFLLAPLGFSLYLTFTRWNPLSEPKWVGLQNYRYLLNDETFHQSLVNTFVFGIGTVGLGVPLALVLAFAFMQVRGKGFWRSVYWLPMVTNIVAVAYLWQFILDPTYGLINRGLNLFGLPGPQWLQDPAAAMWAVVFVAVWVLLGQNMVLFSAGLEGIDETFYEAARIDGAAIPQVFWFVTLPLLRPTLLFVTTTTFIAAMGTFALTLTLVMTEGGPRGATNVTALYMYRTAFEDLRMGRASAMAFVLFVLVFLVTLVQLRVFRRGGLEAY